jgi:hypothetical protein
MLVEGYADIRECNIKITPTEKSIEIKLHNHQGSLRLSLSRHIATELFKKVESELYDENYQQLETKYFSLMNKFEKLEEENARLSETGLFVKIL